MLKAFQWLKVECSEEEVGTILPVQRESIGREA